MTSCPPAKSNDKLAKLQRKVKQSSLTRTRLLIQETGFSHLSTQNYSFSIQRKWVFSSFHQNEKASFLVKMAWRGIHSHPLMKCACIHTLTGSNSVIVKSWPSLQKHKISRVRIIKGKKPNIYPIGAYNITLFVSPCTIKFLMSQNREEDSVILRTAVRWSYVFLAINCIIVSCF